MKNIVFCNYYEQLNKDDFMFANNDVQIGDDLLRPMHELKKLANARGITVATAGSMEVRDADAIVFMDMPENDNPHFLAAKVLQKPMYLMVLESKLVRPENYDRSNEQLFTKIFTYDDSFVDNTKYFKLNYSYIFPDTINKDLTLKKKLCVMIAGNKSVTHPLELYSKRLEAIDWFEATHPDQFDLFGGGWDVHTFTRFEFLNRFRIARRLAAKRHPSYRGRIVRKKPVLETYRFSICYENARDIPGYITEKIFDCFFAGCVPVYWGAGNVLEHIPGECFIDKRDFPDYETLYDYMCSMTDRDYLAYLESIDRFLHSEKSRQFSCLQFAESILDQIAA